MSANARPDYKAPELQARTGVILRFDDALVTLRGFVTYHATPEQAAALAGIEPALRELAQRFERATNPFGVIDLEGIDRRAREASEEEP